MKKSLLVAFTLWAALSHSADYKIGAVTPLTLGKLEGKGQVLSPSVSPQGEALSFEYMAAKGDTLEVYTAQIEPDGAGGFKLKEPEPVMAKGAKDLFSVSGGDDVPVSEQAVWGPSTKRGTQLVFAATRREGSRGGNQINFDLMYIAKGKKRFLTDHPENDSNPVFSPGGEYLAFTSGRTGQGDIYLYSFFSEEAHLIRLTFEEAGAELNPTFSPDGKKLVYIAHLGGTDSLAVIDDPAALAAIKGENDRQAALRSRVRDLTSASGLSSFAPSVSPDSKWIAFYVHPKNEVRSDLYVVAAEGGAPRLLAENVLAGSRAGPAWSPDSDGLFVVEENAQAMNPILWVPLAAGGKPARFQTGTELNTDIECFYNGKEAYLVFAAQGGGEKDEEKRWRKLFLAKLER